MRIFLCALFIVIIFSTYCFSESETVFEGLPKVKISEGGINRVIDDLPMEKAVNLACVISKIGDKYYWASRENKEMYRYKSGAFITYYATDGSGYVRIIFTEMKAMASLMDKTEAEFDYIEHLLIGLRSITYYGVNK